MQNVKKQKSTISLKTTPEKAFLFLRRNPGNTTPFNIRQTFIRILSFSQRSLSRTTLTQSFGIQKVLVFSNTIFLNLLDPNQTVFLTAAILKGLD